MDSSVQIEERAAEWLARRDGGEWSASDEAALAAWLEQTTLHVVAFVRLEAAWVQAKRLKALGTGGRPGVVPSPQEWQLAPFFGGTASVNPNVAEQADPRVTLRPTEDIRRRCYNPGLLRSGTVKRRAFAASLLLAIGAGIALYVWPFGSTFGTPVGGIASVPMSDGSKVTLNTDSRIRLEVTKTERRVELDRGEAFFEVAKDSSRPFVVVAGDKRIIAVGTQFSVRREGGDVRVFITEGRVRIEDEAESSAHRSAGAGKLLTLSAGSIARTSAAGVLVQEKTIPEVEGYLSWRSGYLLFHGTTLADAVAEFNRYNIRQIVVEDADDAAMSVSGKFRPTQFEAFVRLLEDGFPIRARRVGDQIMLAGSANAQ